MTEFGAANPPDLDDDFTPEPPPPPVETTVSMGPITMWAGIAIAVAGLWFVFKDTLADLDD